MSEDILLSVGLDARGAEADAKRLGQNIGTAIATEVSQRVTKSLRDIMSKAASPGGSQTRPGGGSGGGSNSAVQSAIAAERAYQSALTRTESMVQRISRQMNGNAEMTQRAYAALNTYNGALQAFGARSLQGVQASGAFARSMGTLNHEIAASNGLLVNLNRGFSGTVAAIQAIGASLGGMGGRMAQTLAGLSSFAGRASSAAEGTTAMGGALRALTTGAALATAGVAAVAAVTWSVSKAMTDANDRVTLLQQRFAVLSGSAEGGQAAFAALVKSANQMGVGLEDGAQAFSRFIMAGKDIGLTTSDASTLADTLLKMGRIGGATTSELTGGMIQLGQALAANRLGGDEFRSVMENLPTVARAIAKELGVGVGGLKDLAAEGKITADVITNALFRATQDVDKQFAQLPRTASAMATEIGNNFTLLLSDLDNLFSSSTLVKSVYGFFNDAINKARGLINPTDEERIAQLRDTIAKRQKSIDDRKSAWYGSPFNDQQDATAIANAQRELDDILKRQQERAQKEREDDLQAALQRELSTRTRHQQAVEKIATSTDPIGKAAKERDASIKALDEALSAGAISEGRYRDVLADVNAQYDEAVSRANKRETTLDKARDKMTARIAEIAHEAESTMKLAEATLKGGDAYAEMSRQIDAETKLRELNRQAKEAGITLDEREAKAKLEAASAAQRYNEAASFARNLVDQYATPEEKAGRRLEELKRNYDELLKSGKAIPKEVATAFERAQADALTASDRMSQAFKSFSDDIHKNLKTPYGDFPDEGHDVAAAKLQFIKAFE